MSILAQCPMCRRKQSAKNKKCKCGESLDKFKKAKKVRCWIDYLLPNGKVRRESVGAFEDINAYSIFQLSTARSIRVRTRHFDRKNIALLESHILKDCLHRVHAVGEETENSEQKSKMGFIFEHGVHKKACSAGHHFRARH